MSTAANQTLNADFFFFLMKMKKNERAFLSSTWGLTTLTGRYVDETLSDQWIKLVIFHVVKSHF